MKLEKLHKILHFQSVEMEILKTNGALEKLQAQIDRVLRDIEKLKTEKDRTEKKIEELRKEIKKHREMIEDCKLKAKIAEERLNLVKKAEEYKALLREKAKQEDCAIKLGESLRRLEEELKELEKKGENRRVLKELEELQQELSDLRYSESRLRGRLDELKAELRALFENSEEEVFQEYETLKKRHGLPVALPVDTFGACMHAGQSYLPLCTQS